MTPGTLAMMSSLALATSLTITSEQPEASAAKATIMPMVPAPATTAMSPGRMAPLAAA